MMKDITMFFLVAVISLALASFAGGVNDHVAHNSTRTQLAQVSSSSSQTDFDIFQDCLVSGSAVGDCASSDFNGDGTVNIDDFSLFASVAEFDLDNDGDVDVRSAVADSDYNIFVPCLVSGVATGDCASSDFNGDGSITVDDFGLLVGVLTYDLSGDGVVEYQEGTTTNSGPAVEKTEKALSDPITYVAGINNVPVAQFQVVGRGTEFIVKEIIIKLSQEDATKITNMRLWNNSSPGSQFGVTRVIPSSSNTFTGNVAVGETSAQTFEIFADIKSGLSNTDLRFVVDEVIGEDTSGSPIVLSGDVPLQQVIVGVGQLVVSLGASDPNSMNIVAGRQNIKVGEYEFTATNSDITVQDLMVKIPNGASTAVSQVKLRYKRENGITVTTPGYALSLPNSAQAFGIARFTGLDVHVPANDSATLEVLVDTITAASGARSGEGLYVVLDHDSSFKAVDSAGTQITKVGAQDVRSGGTFYVRKTLPTFTKRNLAGTPATGIPLYEFTVSADPAGSVEIKKISFIVEESGVQLSDYKLREKGSSVNINNERIAHLNGLLEVHVGSYNNNNVITIPAGSSKTYQLYATVVGWSNGDTLSIKLAEDNVQVPNGTALNLDSVSGIGPQGSYIIWSDRSSTSHTVNTKDWTNGYLLEDFTNNTQTFGGGSQSGLSVQVTQPNGGETWHTGSTKKIKWQSSPEIDQVSIGWSLGTGSLNWIANNIPNTGSYDWKVNVGNLSEGSSRSIKIYIIGYDTGVGSVSDLSDGFFTVTRPRSGGGK